MELAVIILNWNAAADTVQCAQRIAAWRRLRPTIWVVDNGSTDGSAEAISRECPHTHIVLNPTNQGFAGGNNRGIVEALAAGDAPILLLNNDASIEEEDVSMLLDTLQADHRIGCVGPLLFDAENRDRLLAAGGRDPVHHHHSHILSLASGEPVRVVEYVPGTALLARSELFRTVGLLDEDYFFTMEAADLCMRARKLGHLSVVDTRARAFHSLGRSSGLRETLHTYYIIRNRFLFIRKFYPQRKIALNGVWTLYSLALCAKLELRGKQDTVRAVWLGLRDGLHGRFGGRNELFL
jgi:alpha-1,3-rhamnosyl/mannosyltransferase